MGWISSIFGSKEVINKTVDGIYQAVDKAILTDEEKLDFKNMDKELFLKGAELKIKLNESFHPYKLMQRFIALLFTLINADCFHYHQNFFRLFIRSDKRNFNGRRFTGLQNRWFALTRHQMSGGFIHIF